MLFVVRAILLFAGLGCLSSCGFKPLYSSTGILTSSTAEENLSQIKIGLIPDREGQILRNHLLDILNPAGEPLDPQAYLEVNFKFEKAGVSVRRDGTVQRFRITGTVDITLKDKDKKTILYQDKLKHAATFSLGDLTADTGYASIVSEADAKKRVVELLAHEIHLVLATYYQKWGTKNADFKS